MATYNEEHLTKLGQLKLLAEKVKSECASKTEFDELSTKVNGLVTAGGEPNKIEKIKVNGDEQSVGEDKSVDITVPTRVSDLTNDENYQKDTDVQTAIKTAIAATGHASFKKVESLPEAAAAEENVLYLYMNAKTKHYDIYAKVQGESGAELVQLDDTTVDLSGYATTESVTSGLAGKVDKEGSKVLSDNNYTSEEKAKLSGIDEGANNYTHPSHTAAAEGFYKVTVDDLGHVTKTTKVVKTDITGLGIPGENTTYTEATVSAPGLMSADDKKKLDGMELATDEEVNAMLAEVFPEA